MPNADPIRRVVRTTTRLGLVALLGASSALGAPGDSGHRSASHALDLADCVHVALARNPSLLDAMDEEQRAALRVRLAEADFNLKITPNVDGGVRGGNTTNQNFGLELKRKILATGTEVELSGGTRIFSTVPQTTVPYLSEVRVTVAQPLLQGWTRLENSDRLDRAERERVSSRFALESAREDVVLQTVRAYYAVVRAAQLRDVARTSLSRMRELVSRAEARLASGRVSKMDVYRAEIQKTRVENGLAEQEARLETAIEDLQLLMGLEPDVPLEIDPSLQGPTMQGVSLGALTDEASGRRADLRDARAGVEDSERQLVLARHRLWPALDLVGSYARQGTGDSFNDSLDLDRTEWTVGFRTSVALDRTEEEVAVSEAEIRLRADERRYRHLARRVTQQVRQAARRHDRRAGELVLSARVLEQAEQQRDLAQYRYDKGLGDNFDLVQAEEQVAEARAALTLGRIEQAIAAAEVRRAAGILTEAFVDPAILPAADEVEVESGEEREPALGSACAAAGAEEVACARAR